MLQLSSPKSKVAPRVLGDRIATAIIRGLGYLEFGLGLVVLFYAGQGFYEKYTFAGVYWEGIRDLNVYFALYTGAAFLIAGGGIIWMKRWPFILHLPLLAWSLFLGAVLMSFRS